MAFVPVLWSVWGVSIFLVVAVSIYAARLGRNEEDQLYLAESSSHVKSEQDAIAARLSKIAPVKHTILALAGVMTLLVLAYYIMDAVKQLR